MKNWKRQWKTELDTVIPELSDSVKNAPINRTESSTPVHSTKKVARFSLKSKIITACASIAVVMIVALSWVFIPIINGGGNGDNGDDFVPAVITVEINPKATFVLDENGNAINVVAMNSDADVILADKTRFKSMINKPVSKAVEVFVDYATRLGYLNVDEQDAIRLSRVGGWKKDWNNSINNDLKEYFKNNNYKVAVLNEEVALTEFCTRTGVSDIKSVSDLTTWMASAPTLYGARDVGDFGFEVLQQTYIDEVVKTFAVNDLSEMLKRLIIDVSDAQTSIGQALIKGDYVKISYVRSQFNLKYGTSFRGYDDMLSFFMNVTNNMSELITRILTVDSPLNFSLILEEIENSFKIDVGAYKKLAIAPESLSDYLKKQEVVCNMTFNKKVSDNRKVIDAEREDFDYDGWLLEFVSNGGLEEIW